jgi:hypothetical protein
VLAETHDMITNEIKKQVKDSEVMDREIQLFYLEKVLKNASN